MTYARRVTITEDEYDAYMRANWDDRHPAGSVAALGVWLRSLRLQRGMNPAYVGFHHPQRTAYFCDKPRRVFGWEETT